jgi:hypothetical protein
MLGQNSRGLQSSNLDAPARKQRGSNRSCRPPLCSSQKVAPIAHQQNESVCQLRISEDEAAVLEMERHGHMTS